jgi:hypothetical protein
VQFLGAIVRVKARCGQHSLSVDTFNQAGQPSWARGDKAEIHFAPEHLVVLD